MHVKCDLKENNLIEEFDIPNEEISLINSTSLKKKDILYLHDLISSTFKKNKINPKYRYTVITRNSRKSFSDPKMINFNHFESTIEGLLIEIFYEKEIDIQILLLTYEKDKIVSEYNSHFRIKANNSDLVTILSKEIKLFFKKRKNYHFLIHKYPIFISLPLIFGLLAAIKKFIDIPENIKYIFLALSFFIFTNPLRKLFPYTFFKEENKKKVFIISIISVVILAIIGNGAYDFVRYIFNI